MVHVLILAAGYGTRLYALVKDTPKPLLPIQNKLLIDYIVEKVIQLPDVRELWVVVNAKFYQAFEQWASQQRTPFSLKIINDGTTSPENRLGSVGDIEFALKQNRMTDDLLVVGGDNLFDYSLDNFIRFSARKAPAITIGLYDIKDREEAKKFGVVMVDKQSRVVGFEEKPQHPKSTLISMCAYYFPNSSLPYIGQYLQECRKADAAGDYIRWMCQHQTVYGFQFDGQWYDIGSVESYQAAQKQFRAQ